MTIKRDLIRRSPLALDGLSEERLGRRALPLGEEQEVDRFPSWSTARGCDRSSGNIAALAPASNRRMSANPDANGGLLMPELELLNIANYAVKVEKPGGAPPRRQQSRRATCLGRARHVATFARSAGMKPRPTACSSIERI